ncbi:hypothetical protein HDU98_005694 [Podochytrium sp. JEL0797]|nr:hypothetical protein HDU98_005694 [Podochytrium sp. JEL0797]
MPTGSRTAKTPCNPAVSLPTPTLTNIPREVIQRILLYLPMDPLCIESALSCSTIFDVSVFNTVGYALVHFKAWWHASGKSIWEFLDAKELYGTKWRCLPTLYQAAILSLLVSAEPPKRVGGSNDDDDDNPYSDDSLDFHERWQLSSPQFARLVEILMLPQLEFTISSGNHRLFRWACALGHKDVVSRLLKLPLTNPSALENWAVFGACCGEHWDVLHLLLADPRLDLMLGNPNVVSTLAQHARFDELLKILADPSIDPSLNESAALLFAVSHGHVNAVMHLLADPRIKGKENDVFLGAIQLSHFELVHRLLESDRVDPSAENNVAIQMVAMSGDVDLCRMLLADPRVDPSDDGNTALREAVLYNRLPIVELLLQHPRVRPGARNLADAVDCGYVEGVRLLLKDGRVDPSLNDNEVVLGAAENGAIVCDEVNGALLSAILDEKDSSDNGRMYSEIFWMLMGDERVKASLSEEHKRIIHEMVKF